MKISCVTLTGADSSVNTKSLFELSEKYPHVEWAILFSQSKTGMPRYPSYDWVAELAKLNSTGKMKLSAHLCGQWVDHALRGHFGLLHDSFIYNGFKRVQLNMGPNRLQEAIESKRLIESIDRHTHQSFIFGGNYKKVNVNGDFFANNHISPLFDASGGRGIQTKDWPSPFTTNTPLIHGYAGGLSPDNLVEELEKISSIVDQSSNNTIWIDMESSLRKKTELGDKFDLEKCEQILKAIQKWLT